MFCAMRAENFGHDMCATRRETSKRTSINESGNHTNRGIVHVVDDLYIYSITISLVVK